MFRSRIYAAAFFLILAGSPATAQTATDTDTPMPAEATAASESNDATAATDPEEPASDDECNLPCQIGKSPLTPGGGGGFAPSARGGAPHSAETPTSSNLACRGRKHRIFVFAWKSFD